jgi:predicted lipoprotein with Yx(FWY)xxD motif
MALTPSIRAVAASAFVLCAVAVSSGCGKTITIGSSKPAAAPAAASATSAPAAAPASQDGGNGALQLVDSTAAQNGKNGNGGTVVGLTVQEASPPLNAAHLININQASLYRFDTDTTYPSRSNCNDACAAKWPPVTIAEGGSVYLAGVDPKKVGAIRRKDGDVQITIGGRPIYRFSGDTKPGDLNGQGVGGTWFAVGPTGQKVTGGK